MRISDWSSYVCSSDLFDIETIAPAVEPVEHLVEHGELALHMPAPAQDGAVAGRDRLDVEALENLRDRLAHGRHVGALDPPVTGIEQEGAHEGEVGDIVLVVVEIGRASCRERVCQYV